MMILRRLARAFLHQDWNAVLIELVIVIRGVWIGLQAHNWNAEHARRATATAARDSLVANLQRDIREFKARERYYSSLYAHSDVVLVAMNDPARLDEIGAWRFVESNYRLGQIWPFAQSRQVYRELEGKGDLDLIGGLDIRTAVAEYYDSWGRSSGSRSTFRIRFAPGRASFCPSRFRTTSPARAVPTRDPTGRELRARMLAIRSPAARRRTCRR